MEKSDLATHTLDYAVSMIKDKIDKHYSIPVLLQEAKKNKINICFIPNNRELKYIRLDKESDHWVTRYCDPLNTVDDDNIKYVVIPLDNKDQYFSNLNYIDSGCEKVFPLLSNIALSQFERNENNKIAKIKPNDCKALDDNGNIIEIAIVEIKWISMIHGLADWLEDNGMQKKYNDGYYYEALSFMEIDRSELRVQLHEINTYIDQRLAEQKKLDHIKKPSPKEKILTKTNLQRLEKLELWISSQPDSFDSHNHTMTQEQVWSACTLDPRSKSVQRTFFQKVAASLITFKAGRPSKTT